MSVTKRAAAICILGCAFAGAVVCGAAPGQRQGPATLNPPQPPPPIDRQLQSIGQIAWQPGVPHYYWYWHAPQPGAVYAAGGRRAAVRAWRQPYWYAYPPYPVFEPWPLAAGVVYPYSFPYPFPYRIGQPLGFKLIQTGPNSYIYRPVYESDLQPKQQPAVTPAQEAPSQQTLEPVPAPGTSSGAGPEEIPAPPAERGPQEF